MGSQFTAQILTTLPTNEMNKLTTYLRKTGSKTSRFQSLVAALAIGLLLALCPSVANATTVIVTVGDGGFFFFPSSVMLGVGDTVQWTWSAGGHTSTSGAPGSPTGFWDSGFLNQGQTFSFTFNSAGSFPYFCSAHGA
jgi:plastocyanin